MAQVVDVSNTTPRAQRGPRLKMLARTFAFEPLKLAPVMQLQQRYIRPPMRTSNGPMNSTLPTDASQQTNSSSSSRAEVPSSSSSTAYPAVTPPSVCSRPPVSPHASQFSVPILSTGTSHTSSAALRAVALHGTPLRQRQPQQLLRKADADVPHFGYQHAQQAHAGGLSNHTYPSMTKTHSAPRTRNDGTAPMLRPHLCATPSGPRPMAALCSRPPVTGPFLGNRTVPNLGAIHTPARSKRNPAAAAAAAAATVEEDAEEDWECDPVPEESSIPGVRVSGKEASSQLKHQKEGEDGVEPRRRSYTGNAGHSSRRVTPEQEQQQEQEQEQEQPEQEQEQPEQEQPEQEQEQEQPQKQDAVVPPQTTPKTMGSQQAEVKKATPVHAPTQMGIKLGHGHGYTTGRTSGQHLVPSARSVLRRLKSCRLLRVPWISHRHQPPLTSAGMVEGMKQNLNLPGLTRNLRIGITGPKFANAPVSTIDEGKKRLSETKEEDIEILSASEQSSRNHTGTDSMVRVIDLDQISDIGQDVDVHDDDQSRYASSRDDTSQLMSRSSSVSKSEQSDVVDEDYDFNLRHWGEREKPLTPLRPPSERRSTIQALLTPAGANRDRMISGELRQTCILDGRRISVATGLSRATEVCDESPRYSEFADGVSPRASTLPDRPNSLEEEEYDPWDGKIPDLKYIRKTIMQWGLDISKFPNDPDAIPPSEEGSSAEKEISAVRDMFNAPTAARLQDTTGHADLLDDDYMMQILMSGGM